MKYSDFILGFDEVGRGSLAGPVVVGCVMRDPVYQSLPPKNVHIKDSKQLTAKQREISASWIIQNYCYGIGQATADEIDNEGIVKAVILAASRAKDNLEANFKILDSGVTLVVDGREQWFHGCIPVIKGDTYIHEISCASIIAKVFRDRLMKDLSVTYPDWGFEHHVGYGTLQHRQALGDKELIPGIHRRSFCSHFLSQDL